MKRSVSQLRAAIAVVLVLTTNLALPLAASASMHDHVVQSTSQIHFAHSARISDYQISDANLPAGCDASVIGCCTMMLCHPAISTNPHEMPLVSTGDALTATSVAPTLSTALEVTVPPPRSAHA